MRGLEDAFLFIANMSLTAAYAALIIIIFRSLFLKKLPKVFSYSLWAFLLFRLLSPVSFTSAFSFLSFFKPPLQEGAGMAEYLIPDPARVPPPLPGTPGGGLEEAARIGTGPLPEITESAAPNFLQMLPSIAAYLWALGIIAFVIYSIYAYIRVTAPLRSAVLFDDPTVDEARLKVGLRRKANVYITDQIPIPFVAGLFVPKVYIPAGCPKKDLPYLLAHEFVHIKRFDYLIRPLSYLLSILHWFNPLMWVSFSLMSKDMEMSCDEKVMSILGSETRQDYSHTLLSLATGERGLLPGSLLAFGESHVKSRIKNVLGFKKPALYLIVTACIVLGVLGFSLLANPDTNSLDMEANFTPLSIEMDLMGEMRVIQFKEEDKEHIAGLLQYDTWRKAALPYDLASMAYISGEENKVIALYEDVDGYTFIQLYRGFGGRDYDFYQAPARVYNDLQEFLIINYVEDEDEQDNHEGSAPPDDAPPREALQFLEFIQGLSRRYGYDWGARLYHGYEKTEVLLYNQEIASQDDLQALLIEIDLTQQIELTKEVYLPEDLLGYSFSLKFGDSSSKKHLLGVRSKYNEEEKKLFSDLVILDKDTLQQFTILQSYVMDYDPDSGMVPQGDIPTVVDFTVDLVDDYIIYQDTDLFWKAQDVTTGKVYTSTVQLPDAEVLWPYRDSGENIYILRCLEDDTVLAFNKSSKEFRLIPYAETIVQAYPLEHIESARFESHQYEENGDNTLLQLSEEEIYALKKAFNDAFPTIAEFTEWDSLPAFSPGFGLSIYVTDEPHIYIFELDQVEGDYSHKFMVSYTIQSQQKFNRTYYILQSEALQEFFDTSRQRFPDL